MKRLVALFLALAWSQVAAGDDTLVVGSIRCYQIEGPSNIHLYLYGLDGKLRKQLTNKVGCDDVDPSFSYDGKSVCFTRKSTIPDTAQDEGLYQVDLATDTATRLKENDTYVSVPVDELHYSFAVPESSWNVSESTYSVSPDGLYRITLKPLPSSDPKINPPMQHFLSTRGGPAIDVTTLEGFPTEEAKDYFAFEQLNGIPFVIAKNFAAVFLLHHLDSTDGDQIWGLNLKTEQWTKMSQNGVALYHPPGAAGIFLACNSLYEPLGNSGKQVNCCYLEWWDSNFKMTKLTPALSVFYSAAVFHPAAGWPNPDNETLTIGGSFFP